MAPRKNTPDLTERLARPLDLAARNVRAATAVAPVRPAYAAGFRAALATVVPLLVAHVLHLAGGTWMSLAGFSGALVDKGGAYDARAAAIASLTVFGAIAVFMGPLASHNLATAVALTFAVALVCALGRAWGNTGASVGGSVLNMFVISLAYPTTLTEAIGRAGYAMIGGLWAALVALVLWPIRPYRPARLAVADAFDKLADYVTQVVDTLATEHVNDDAFPAGSMVVRGALENARTTLATIRRGRPGESGRGERLIVLRETADQMFGNLIALVETIEAIPPAARKRDRLDIVVAALRHPEVSVGKRRDLRQMGHAHHLPAARKRLQQPPDRRCDRSADAGVHLVENQRGDARRLAGDDRQGKRDAGQFASRGDAGQRTRCDARVAGYQERRPGHLFRPVPGRSRAVA